MTTITLNDLDHCDTLSHGAMQRVAGGLTPDLQWRLNQLGANLYRNAQVIFDPRYIYGMIRTSQIASRRIYGRQMINPFPTFSWH